MKKVLLLAAVLFAVVSANAQFINTPSSQSQSKTQARTSSSSGDIAFRGEFNTGMMIGKTKYDDEKIDGTMIAPVFTGTFGVKIHDFVFLGAGVGFKYMTQNGSEYGTDYSINSFMMPIFAEVKAFIPVSDAVAPFVMADLGYGVRLSGEYKDDWDFKRDTKGGMCYKFGAGVTISDFIIALGYDCQKFGLDKATEDFKSSGFFFSLGYAF
ncbi:MAG: outer membrane beta-barrel protein [Bacteroidales bacterium]|nr:outer membrane beta-barrel protein [Bacteroidales bacterium]